MKTQSVTIIDYGMCNLWSISSALQYLGFNAVISNDPSEILNTDALILPGVGSFRKAMSALKENNLDRAIVDAVKTKGSKILGICLGMQLLGADSTEDGFTSGLGLIPNGVDKFSTQNKGTYKIPHVGFNLVHSHPEAHLFKGLPQAADFYFVHSYRMSPDGLSGLSTTCNYGDIFLASYEQENIFATQFHPEKSQTNGLLLLQNFLTH